MEWLGQEHPEAVNIKDAQKHADEFLQFRMDKGEAPSTLSTIKAAMAKVFGISSSTLLKHRHENVQGTSVADFL